jgi:hypothetical protein
MDPGSDAEEDPPEIDGAVADGFVAAAASPDAAGSGQV